jgi:enoyl-CoA hydratase/carnithine racemase
MSTAMWTALARLVKQCSMRKHLRVLVVTGAGGNFCAGADITEFAQVRHDSNTGEAYHEELIRPALQALIECPLPVIAAISGQCVGGGLEIAACCDLRLASQDACFGVPVLYRGFPLAPFEMACVLSAFGKPAVMRLLLQGQLIDANEALQLQIAHQLVAKEQLCEAATTLAKRLATAAPLAVAATKRMAQRLSPVVVSLSLSEQQKFYAFLDSQDYKEGIAAFLEKRSPNFSGT